MSENNHCFIIYFKNTDVCIISEVTLGLQVWYYEMKVKQ